MTLALLHISVWLASQIIGLVAAALTAMGISFGGRLGEVGAAGPSAPAASRCC